MKIFDFEFAEKTRNPEFIKWIKDNYNNRVTEAEFVVARLRTKDSRKGASRNYSPSAARQEYKILKGKYGFFPFYNEKVVVKGIA